MRYIRFTCGTDFLGMDDELYASFTNNYNSKDFEEYARDLAFDNASSWIDIERYYSIDPEDYKTEEEYDEAYVEAEEQWNEGIWWEWEEITEAEWRENNGVEG